MDTTAEDMLPYKEYSVLLAQSGTSAPVATVLSNDTGITITWSRLGAGLYQGSFSVAQDPDKCQSIMPVNSVGNTVANGFVSRIPIAGACFVSTFNDNATQEDDLLFRTPFILRIYP